MGEAAQDIRCEIEGGIEHAYRGERYVDSWCARCGSSAERVTCWRCGGEGVDGHDCGEDSCCCLHPEDNVLCDVCDGTGGWWRCLSTRDWCLAHPLPGREHIVSTAQAAGTSRDG